MRGARSFLILLFSVASCSVALASSIGPAIVWRSEELRTRSQKAGTSSGFADSAFVTYEAGVVDTTVATRFPVVMNIGTSDSLQNIVVNCVFDAAISNPASDDTVYVALDASNDNGVTWRILNSGSIGINGFATGAATAGVLRGYIFFNGKANSTTNVTGRSPGLIPTSSYGSWFGDRMLRVRTLSGSGGGNTAAHFRIFITYPSIPQ